MDNTRLLAAIILVSSFDASSLSAQITLFPNLANQRHIDNVLIGFIFSVFTMACFVIGLFMGNIIKKIGKEKLIMICQLSMFFTRIIFGSLIYIENEICFFVLATLARISMGIFTGIIYPVFYSLIGELYLNEAFEKINILELFIAFGGLCGPLLTYLYYNYLGYFNTFLIQSISGLIFGLPLWKCFSEQEYIPKITLNKRDINITKIPWNFRIIINFLFFILSIISFSIFIPDYQNYIVSLGESKDTPSLLYVSLTFGYLLSMILLRLVLKKQQNYQWLFLSSSLITISLFFLGPEPLLSITNNIAKLVSLEISLFLIGFSNGIINITIINELIINIKNRMDGDHVEEASSLLFTIGLTLGEFLGPILGGLLIDNIGFQRTGSFYGLFYFCFLIFYWTSILILKKRDYRVLIEV